MLLEPVLMVEAVEDGNDVRLAALEVVDLLSVSEVFVVVEVEEYTYGSVLAAIIAKSFVQI